MNKPTAHGTGKLGHHGVKGVCNANSYQLVELPLSSHNRNQLSWSETVRTNTLLHWIIWGHVLLFWLLCAIASYNAESILLNFQFLADFSYSLVSNKELLLLLSADPGAETCDVDTSHLLHH